MSKHHKHSSLLPVKPIVHVQEKMSFRIKPKPGSEKIWPILDFVAELVNSIHWLFLERTIHRKSPI